MIYKQHPHIVGYARTGDLLPLLNRTQPGGSYITIGLDHPECWAEEPPYEWLTPLYSSPVNTIDNDVFELIGKLVSAAYIADHKTAKSLAAELDSLIAVTSKRPIKIPLK